VLLMPGRGVLFRPVFCLDGFALSERSKDIQPWQNAIFTKRSV